NVVAKHCTPHHNARRRAVVSCSVNAMSGSWGRSFDSNCAVRPDRVITTMARARTSWAMVAAACAIEMVVLRSAGPRAPNMDGVDDSAARAMRSIIVTASTGYSPTAVSADSITASVPSRIAVGEYPVRSEEHTSELQSRVDLVCRLLLEKKKDSN